MNIVKLTVKPLESNKSNSAERWLGKGEETRLPNPLIVI